MKKLIKLIKKIPTPGNIMQQDKITMYVLYFITLLCLAILTWLNIK